MNKNIDHNIIDNNLFDLKNFFTITGLSILIFFISQLFHWVVYLRNFNIISLNAKSGKMLRVRSPKDVWVNLYHLTKYYLGLSYSKTSGRFYTHEKLATSNITMSPQENILTHIQNDDIMYKEAFKSHETISVFNNEDVRIDASHNDEIFPPSQTNEINKPRSSISNPKKFSSPQHLNNHINNLRTSKSNQEIQNDPQFKINSDKNVNDVHNNFKIKKKHIKISAYFGQNLRRIILLKSGVFSILCIQLVFALISGAAYFDTWQQFRSYIRGDFLYKDYMGVVTANCFFFGFLTFSMSYILMKNENKSQRVIYREVLKNEILKGKNQEQKKFLSPHVVYFSGLNKNSKKEEIKEQVFEYIDYIKEHETNSSENNSLIFAYERENNKLNEDSNFQDKDFGVAFRRFDKNNNIAQNPSDKESVDRIMVENDSNISIQSNKIIKPMSKY